MEWISVKEKLPKNEEVVLIAILHKYSNAKWKWDILMSYLRKNGYGWSAMDGDGNDYEDPEYWMPFPEYPSLTEKQKLESEKASEDGYKERVEYAKKEYERIVNAGEF